ncbi:MAG: Trp biosynthesis-associated membrane protein [Nakamurella sp.]
MKLSTVALLIVVGAGLIAGAASMNWADATGVDDLRGTLDLTATGGRTAPALVPVALAALAALGALFAARGTSRRLVAALVVLLGLVVGGLAVRGLLGEPALPVFDTSSGVTLTDVRIRPLGPLLAAVGALAMIVAGSVVVAGRTRPRGLAARYERSGAPTTPAPSSADPELAMWKELDAHRDPTLDPTPPDARDRLDRGPGNSSQRGEGPA